MSISTTPRVLTIDQTAEQLQLSRRAVERLIDSGVLQVVRFGRAVRVPIESIDRALEQEH